MKCFIVLLAVVALVVAVEEKKPKEEEKKPEERGGLQWPMPDPYSEGDLMLHGAEIYDRVDEVHKAKVEDEADKSIVEHGREFLRRVAKWFDDNADLKVMSELCRDSRTLNGTINRWRMEIAKEEPRPQASPAAEAVPAAKAAAVQRDQPLPKDDKEEKPKKPDEVKIDAPKANITDDNETISNSTTTSAPIVQNDEVPASKPTEQPIGDFSSSTARPVSNSTDHPAEEGNSTEPAVRPSEKDNYEIERREFYRQVGSNFVRLIQRQYRKEALKADETEYLTRWLADEAVHYGAVSIYCNHGEDVKEIRKQLTTLLEEKA